MEDENKFWLGIWKLVGGCFCVLSMSIAGCTMHADGKIKQMVDKGTNPFDARCAIYGEGQGRDCTIRATKSQ